MPVNHILERETKVSRLADRLEKIATKMRAANDDNNAGKVLQLVEKTRRGELSIAFCGHFSAGKSTMINTLLGVNLLPSNPIPTSANVVKIRGGAKAAHVYTRNNGVLTFDPDTEMEALKKYAVDGDTVEWVEICYPGTFLDEQASLLDTPGIDSTDAAHKIATESALHLADVVIYMMDYNHVQAEENFNFTKTLKDRCKPVYLVINMIDKHIDFELDFDSYRESVEEAFATWSIKPDGIFYTSLAEPDHPENQYDAFRAKLIELIQNGEQLLSESVVQSALYLIDEHVKQIGRQHADQREHLDKRLNVEIVDLDTSDQKQIESAMERTKTQLAWSESYVRTAKDQMVGDLSSLLDNARLTYYSTNEAAERYLESRKSGFKSGFLFAGKKTEEERAQRLQGLLADLREKVVGNLDFLFKEMLSKLPQAYEIRDEAYHAAVHETTIELTTDLLASHVKEGAGTREYVLNYCTDISNAIKAKYRRVGLHFIEQVSQKLEERTQGERIDLQTSLQTLRELAAAHQELALMAETEQATGEGFRAILLEGE